MTTSLAPTSADGRSASSRAARLAVDELAPHMSKAMNALDAASRKTGITQLVSDPSLKHEFAADRIQVKAA